jgi:penicillin-binding protein 2
MKITTANINTTSNKSANEYIMRRYTFVFTIKIICFLVLSWRLFKMQIMNYFLYKKMAINNSTKFDYIFPKRGNILDRNGISMTDNIPATKVVFQKTSQDIEETLISALKILNKKEQDIALLLKKIKRKLKINPNERIVLAKNVNREEMIRIQFNLNYLPGVDIIDSTLRYYKMSNHTSPIIGAISGVSANNNDVSLNKRILNNTDYKVGIRGVEKIFNTQLTGKIGINSIAVNAFGRRVKEEVVENAIDGIDIHTTVDYNIQNELGKLIADKNAAATVLNLKTGEIIAMHSTPNIDPNLYSRGMDNDDWKGIIAAQNKRVFFNKNLSISYPPGSTFKLPVSLVALQNGWDVYKNFHCTGEYQIGNRVFHCWKKEGHGYINFNTAIAQSCNCYFYYMSTKVDIDDIYAMATSLGLGQRTNIGLDNETSGFIPSRAWKRKRFNQIWLPGENANTVLGQGFVEVTPMQMLIMISRIATNKMVVPRFIKNIQNITEFENMNLNPEALKVLHYGLFSNLNSDFGLLRRYRSYDQEWQICGKTGSAQVVSRRFNDNDMKSGRIAEDLRPHGLFVGFAPYHDPKFAVSVVVEHGIGGSISGAPVGVEILSKLRHFV